ncbi:hypothetical protein [Streptomyces sp. H10-C2]|uniref:hypothetical protein n=1 Tax=Streptomyces sp. H10-C2 TaxID=3046210 RepID=UPI0024BA70FC|nr:hypothetical protein [Streptomyces sp. H10-C2]
MDWTSLGQSFADAYSELDANDYLGTLDTEIQEDLPEPAVVDAEEPDGTDKLRQVWRVFEFNRAIA